MPIKYLTALWENTWYLPTEITKRQAAAVLFNGSQRSVYGLKPQFLTNCDLVMVEAINQEG